LEPAERDGLIEHGRRLAADAHRRVELGTPRLAVLGPEGRAWIARVDAEQARLAGIDDPATWAAVVDAFGFGHVYEQARCRLRHAAALLAAGDRKQAGAEAARARQVAVRLRARPLREALDALARRGRLDLGAGPVPGADSVLTPRELDVMRLVAAGLTNRQVGERLHISEKTASVHISHVLAKLDASGRTEAVSIALRRGLLSEPGTGG
jgi:DNA-binding CsgD family transcriptional regulator